MRHNCTSTNIRQQCSYNGYYCDGIHVCVCDAQYYSSSTSPDRLQCDIYLPQLFVSDYLCVATSTLSLLIIFRVFIVPYFNKNACCRIISIDRRIKFLFPFMFFIAIVFNLAQSVANILYGENIFGNQSPSFLFQPLFVFFGQTGLILYLLVVLEFLRSCNGYISQSVIIDTDKFYTMINHLTRLAYCIPPASCCCCFTALIGIQVSKYRNGFIKVYLASTGVLVTASGLLITYAFRFVLKYLQEHIDNFEQSSQEIKTVYSRLRRNYYICATATALVGLILITFGTSNYLMDRAYYAFIFIRIILPLFEALLTLRAYTPDTGRRVRNAATHDGPNNSPMMYDSSSVIIAAHSSVIIAANDHHDNPASTQTRIRSSFIVPEQNSFLKYWIMKPLGGKVGEKVIPTNP